MYALLLLLLFQPLLFTTLLPLTTTATILRPRAYTSPLSCTGPLPPTLPSGFSPADYVAFPNPLYTLCTGNADSPFSVLGPDLRFTRGSQRLGYTSGGWSTSSSSSSSRSSSSIASLPIPPHFSCVCHHTDGLVCNPEPPGIRLTLAQSQYCKDYCICPYDHNPRDPRRKKARKPSLWSRLKSSLRTEDSGGAGFLLPADMSAASQGGSAALMMGGLAMVYYPLCPQGGQVCSHDNPCPSPPTAAWGRQAGVRADVPGGDGGSGRGVSRADVTFGEDQTSARRRRQWCPRLDCVVKEISAGLFFALGSCAAQHQSVLGGGLRRRDEGVGHVGEGRKCPCNATYAGEACCGSVDGVVWEGEGKGGRIVGVEEWGELIRG